MEWIRGPIIGRGSSAAVCLAANPSTAELFAVKSVELSHSGLLQREKCIISQLDSPHVVKCLGFDITCENNKVMYNVFLEYVPGGTLCDLIKKQGNALSEEMIRFYARELLLGLDFLHSNGIVHCDIKGRNVLIGEEDRAVKIADFGCAKISEVDGKAAFSGTPAFMAPEVARGEEQGFAADIWAFGCTVIEMETGSAPWPEMTDPVSALYRIGYSDDVPEFPGWLSGDANDFLSKCLNRNANERWTAAELLLHPFLQRSHSRPDDVETPSRNSPTSVTDRGFWESLQSPCMSPISASTVDSPAYRLRRLIGSSNLPRWEDEEDWVSVRATNGVESISNNLNDLQFNSFKQIIQIVNSSPIKETTKNILQNCIIPKNGVESKRDNLDKSHFNSPKLFTFQVIHIVDSLPNKIIPKNCNVVEDEDEEEDLECLTINGGFLLDSLSYEISFSDSFDTITKVALSFQNVKDLLVPEIQYFKKKMLQILHSIKSLFKMFIFFCIFIA